MQKCTSCDKAPATVRVLDLKGGSVVESHFLCDACAESQGVVHPKSTSVKFTTEILEMFSGWKKKEGSGEVELGEGPVCPGCQLTATEFRMRGRLGCSRCYEVFRSSLLPVLERIHDATSHRGRFPGRTAHRDAAAVPNLTDLRRRLQSAITEERYEDAAQLRDQLERAKEESRPRPEDPR